MKLELYYNTCFIEEESDTESLSSLPAVTQLFRRRIPTWELSFRGHSLSLGLQKSQTDGESPGIENRMGLKRYSLSVALTSPQRNTVFATDGDGYGDAELVILQRQSGCGVPSSI